MKKLPDPLYFIYCSLILAWVGLWAFSTSCGLGQTFDSVQYLACAKSITVGKGFRMADGSPFTAYPPLYPILLSIGNASLFWAKFLQVLCGVVSLMLWLHLARCYFRTILFLRFFGLVWIFSTPILLIHSFVWSEPVFLLILSIKLFFWNSYLRHPEKKSHFWMLVLLGGLLCLQRNAGLVFVFWISMAFLLNQLSFTRLLQTTIYFFLTILPTFFWKFILATPQPSDWIFTGKRAIGNELIHNVQEISLVFQHWFLPNELTSFWVDIVFLGILGFAFLWKPTFFSFPKFFFFIAIVGIGYAASLLLIPSEAIYFSDVERFLAVVYPMFFFLWLMYLEKIYLSFSSSARYTFIVLFLIWLGYPLMRTVKNAQFWHEKNCTTPKSVSKADEG